MGEPHYDTVVVGSGFGGAVMAYRLAQAGLSVCLLERGKAYAPGDFARSPRDWSRNFWDPSEGLHGLFDLWSFRGLEAVVASGLGGGSLIYANVLMRKPEKWFVREDLQHGGYEYWPITYADLERHYKAVEEMLGAQRYPFDRPPYNATAKTRALEEAAKKLGLDWQLPNLAVTFGEAGEQPGEPIRGGPRSLHQRTRYTCRLCGECDIGCNYGSKNTLDHTYLSAIDRGFADIRTRCEVRRFWPLRPRGFEIRYVDHARSNEGRPAQTRTLPEEMLTADQLILAAGALGTSYLLLKNHESFPGIGPALGSRFSGNGDLLAFVTGSRRGGRDGGPHLMDPSHGPVITSAIRVGDKADGDGATGRGFYIEDGGYPQFVNWMFEAAAFGALLRRAVHFLLQWLSGLAGLRTDTDLSAELAAVIGPALRSSTSLPLLGMGRDIPDGRVCLENGLLQVDWSARRSQPYFESLRNAMAEVAGALDARLVASWLSYFNRVITVHPLGGCPMGRDATEGVVDAYGEVFHYPGLWVTDGSAMPGPVGANPSLTIAAFADRAADRVIERHLEWHRAAHVPPSEKEV